MDKFLTSLYYITTVFFLISLVRNAVFWTFLWQNKEYRVDRMLVHFKETRQGREIFFGIESLLKNGIILFFFYSIFNPVLYSFFPFFVFTIYLVTFFRIVRDIKNKKIRYPVFTVKIGAIIFLSFALTSLLYTVPLLDYYFWLLFLEHFMAIIITLLFILFSIPSDFYKDTIINKSIKKISKLKNLTVIGITGSYGKGSTKEFLYTILSHKFNVVKTESTFNTPIGIARTILSKLSNKTKIFIVEMGAYKIGDIAYMSAMVMPKIGILTAINDQHVSLFGNIENIKKAKYELIDSLPKDGLALFNGNNQNTLEAYEKCKKRKILYYADYDNSAQKADIRALDININKFSLGFSIEYKGKRIGKFYVNLVGAHHIQNLLPCIAIALDMKMDANEIRSALTKITPMEKTMEPYITIKNTALIDDTYNANPDAALAACEYMSEFKGKKVYILQPMIELGKHAGEDHFKVAKRIAEVCDVFFVTNSNSFKDIKRGVNSAKTKCKLQIATPSEIAEFITKKCKSHDVVVFEGKEAALPLAILDKEKVYSA